MAQPTGYGIVYDTKGNLLHPQTAQSLKVYGPNYDGVGNYLKADSNIYSYGGTSGSGGSGSSVPKPPSTPSYAGPSATDIYNSIVKSIQDAFSKYTDRANEFDKNNPFTFDDAAAKASAGERYNPYYDAELKDFLSGINTQRSTTNGEIGLLKDLNRIQTAQDKTKLTETIRASQEGFAGAGLYFSGANNRATGLTNIGGIQTNQTREANFNQNMLADTNRLTDLATQEGTGVRHLGAQQTTDIQSEIERQKAEAEAAYQTERSQYIGFPGSSSGFGSGGVSNTLLSGFSSY